MWSSSSNKSDAINPFASLLDKEVSTKGDFEADFTSICGQYNIFRCPNISCTIEGEVRVSDVGVDISNWRALMLSICCVGSKTKQLRVHNCTLTPQHIKDLASALVKAAVVKVVKLQYCSFGFDDGNQNEYIDAFKSLLVDSNQMEFLSLKGSAVPNDIVVGFAPALQNNYKLQSINLSSNLLTDGALDAITQSIRFVGSYRGFSFADNPISVNGIKTILSLFLGAPSMPKDEGEMKAITKLVTDKNKSLKDTNKKRKKAGLVEIPDFSPMPECIKNVEGKPWICNYHISVVDFGCIALSLQDFNELARFLEDSKGVSLSDLGSKVYLPNISKTDTAEVTFTKFSKNIIFV